MSCRTERVPAALGAELLALADAESPFDQIDNSDLENDDAELPLDLEDLQPALPLDLEPKLVGRSAALSRLVGIIERTVREQARAFVALTGPAGAGKSRLCIELGRAATHVRILSVIATPESSVGPLRQLLYARLGLHGRELPDVVRARLTALVDDTVLPRYAADVVARLLPLCTSSDEELDEAAPLAGDPHTFLALRRLFAADAAQKPLCLIFDDVEGATPETVNLIHYLAAGLGSAPVVLRAVGRPSLFEQHPSFGEGDAQLDRIELGPLSQDESLLLMREVLSPVGAAPYQLKQQIAERGRFTPREILELCRYLLEEGVLVPDGQTWQWHPLHRLRWPESLDEILAGRLAALSHAEQDLLGKAAAVGERFWPDAVVALVRTSALEGGDPDGPTLAEIAGAGDRTRQEVVAALAQFVDRGIIVREPRTQIAGERQYRFAFPPWRDVVYETVEAAARRRYHRLLAHWLDLQPEGRSADRQEEIARHLQDAGDGERAAQHYRRAADAVGARYANDQAIRLYSAALDCLGPSDLAGRIHLWHDLGSVLQRKGDNDAAMSAFEHMLRLAWVAASRTKAAVAFNKMGRIHRQKGEPPLALEYLGRGLELFRQAADARGVAGSLDDIAQALWLLGRLDEARARSEEALTMRRAIGDRRSIAASLEHLAHVLRHQGRFDEARASYEEALDLRATLDDKEGLVAAHDGLGILALQRGDAPTAREHWEAALGMAQRAGALPLEAEILLHLGEAALALESRSEARTRFEAAEQIARDVSERRVLGRAVRHLGLLDLTQGNTRAALERLGEALALAEASGIAIDVGRALISLGEVHAATLFDADAEGDARKPPSATRFFKRGIETLRRVGNEAELAWGLERYGRFAAEHGSRSEGRALLEEADTIVARLGMAARDPVRRLLRELAK